MLSTFVNLPLFALVTTSFKLAFENSFKGLTVTVNWFTMTEFSKYGDEKMKLIIQLLGQYPKGLGQNEMCRLLSNYMAPGTLKVKLDKLVENGHVRFDPKNWRQGQKKVFIHTEAYAKYLELIDRIENETRKYLSELKKYDGSPELVDPNFNYLILKIRQFYSIPNIIGSIRSWNYAWTKDRDTVVEILTLLYVSFHEVDEVINKLVKEHVQELDRRTREMREDIEKNYPDIVEVLDNIDIQFLNFWKNPESILDILEKGTFINHERMKRT